MVYSTCSLSPSQNECVVENAVALANSYYGIRCLEKSLKPIEKHLTTTGLYKFHTACKRGILVVPYLVSNFGPMYTCKLQRIRWFKYFVKFLDLNKFCYVLTFWDKKIIGNNNLQKQENSIMRKFKTF